jgi:hypothetical protein
VQGTVTLAVGTAFGALVLPHVLRPLAARYPGMRLRLLDDTSAGITRRVVHAEADLGIGSLSGDTSALLCQKLLTAPLGVLANPAHFALKASAGARDLAALPLLKEGPDTSIMQLLRLHGSSLVAQMEGGIEVSSLSIQLAMAQAGVGVAVLSALGASHPQARGMRFVPLRPAVRREVFLQQRRDRPLSASARVLRDALLAPLHVPEAHPSIRLCGQGVRPQAASMKVPALAALLRQPAQQGRQVHQPRGHQVADLAAAVHVALPGAAHGQQARAQQRVALGFTHMLPHDHVHRAGFVLQRDKDGALGRLRLLAHGDDAAGRHGAPMRQRGQLLRIQVCPMRASRARSRASGWRRSVRPRRRSQKRSPRPRARGQSSASSFTGAPRSSAGARWRAAASHTCWRRWPDRTLQRVGGGQGVEVFHVELRAQGQVFGAGKGRLLARRHDALRALSAQAAHQAQAQAHCGAVPVCQRAVPVAVRHVGGEHLHAVAFGVLNELRRAGKNPWAAS